MGRAASLGPDISSRLDRIEAKLDQILARFSTPGAGDSAVPPSPRPREAPHDPLHDPLHVDRTVFAAFHDIEGFPEILKGWLRKNAGRWTHAQILDGVSRRHPSATTIGGVRLGAFMRRHHEWLGVVREKDGKQTVWKTVR